LFASKNDGFVTRVAKWPPFKKRNVYRLFKNFIQSNVGPKIYINATVTRFSVASNTLTDVRASSAHGSALFINAKKVVIASGCIESTRLLLLLDKQLNHGNSPKNTYLGLGFHDHLSCIVAELVVKDRKALNRIMGFEFSKNGTMRNIRFEMNPNSKLRENIPPCFFHVSFDQNSDEFYALRTILRSLQRMAFPSFHQLISLLKGFPWLIKALYWRVRYRKLLYPEHTAVHLHAVIEQQSIPENRIGLSDVEVDPLGVPLAEISWQITAEDKDNIYRAASAFSDWWADSSLNKIATLKLRPQSQIINDVGNCGGIYHPGGTTRMAHSANEGVVDKNLKVFGFDNLWLVSTSVMPTGGAANPTMTLLMLAINCADDIGKSLQAKASKAS
jgi:hypothetical protein